MVKEAQLMAKIDPELAKRLKKALIDDDLTFRAWLIARIEEYLKQKEAEQ